MPPEAPTLNTDSTPAVINNPAPTGAQLPIQVDNQQAQVVADNDNEVTPAPAAKQSTGPALLSLEDFDKEVIPANPAASVKTKTVIDKNEVDPEDDLVAPDEDDSKDEVEEQANKDGEQSVTDKDAKDGVIHGNDKRDFTGFTDDERKALKKLDNPRFNKIAPLWRDLKAKAAEAEQIKAQNTKLQQQLKEGGIPDSWVEHPNAYQLSPKYQELSNKVGMLEFEENFYREQAVAVMEGKDWQRIEGYNNGQPVLSGPLKADNRASVWLNAGVSKLAAMKGQTEGQISLLQQQFSQQYSQSQAFIKQETDNFVNRLIPELRPKDDTEKLEMRKLLGDQYKSNPLTYFAENAYAVIIQQARYIKTLLDKGKTEVKLNNDRKLAGPAINRTPRDPGANHVNNGKPAKKGDEILSLDSFLPKD